MASSDDEDDYLSEKFLAKLTAPATSKKASSSATYAERRREAARQSDAKNRAHAERNRGRDAAMREGLSKSLFERAREEDEAAAAAHVEKRRKLDGGGEEAMAPAPATTGNKALAMMMKMGFKEGQALGPKKDEDEEETEEEGGKRKKGGPLIEPLPLAVWSGRQGLGGRAPRMFAQPATTKYRKPEDTDEDATTKQSQEAYRNRTREEFIEKRDLGRLRSARKTLIDLDDKNGVQFDVRWIDPSDVSTIPDKLRQRLEGSDEIAQSNVVIGFAEDGNRNEAARLRAQMRADALETLAHHSDTGYGYSEAPEARREAISELPVVPPPDGGDNVEVYDEDAVQDAMDWLQLNASDRLRFTLEHLRTKYFYCFWCGAKYEDSAELASECPGESEEAHD